MGNRKLIRPSLTDLRDQGSAQGGGSGKKKAPPDQTNAEQYYYLKQMASKNPIVVKLVDGETITGVLEWYDKSCLKVNRESGPNLLIPKNSILYLHKKESGNGR